MLHIKIIFIWRSLVLIETLWNVNFTTVEYTPDSAPVLIETLWNVNEIGERNFRIGK